MRREAEAAPEAEARSGIAADLPSMDDVMNAVDALRRASAGGAEPRGTIAAHHDDPAGRAEQDHAASPMAIAS